MKIGQHSTDTATENGSTLPETVCHFILLKPYNTMELIDQTKLPKMLKFLLIFSRTVIQQENTITITYQADWQSSNRQHNHEQSQCHHHAYYSDVELQLVTHHSLLNDSLAALAV